MGFDQTDLFIIGVVILGVVFLISFYSSNTGRYVVMNRSFNTDSIVLNKSICEDVNCSDIERYAKSVVKTTSTTTTTIKIYFFNTSGAVSSLVKSGYGDILINCGSKPDVMDKVYFTGSTKLKNIFLTSMDLEHGGGCGRTAMMLDHGEIFDAGANITSNWSGDYYRAAGDYRRVLNSGAFRLGRLVVNTSILNDRQYLLKVVGANFSVSFIGDCSKDYPGFSNSNIIVCDRDVDEAYIIRNNIHGIVVLKSDQSFESTYVKYGVKAYKMDFNKDYEMIITNRGFDVGVKKGI